MKRTFSILLTAVLAVLMCVSSYALTLDIAEAETVMDQAVLADETATVTPGLNLLTGTTEAESFETEGMQVPNNVWTFGGVTKASIGTNPVHSGSKALDCVPAGTYPQVHFITPVEAGRKYYIEAKGMATSEYAEYIWWLCQNDANDKQKVLKTVDTVYRDNNVAGKWTTLSATVTSNSTNNFYFQNKTATGSVYHFDDIKVIPYYMVTYIGLDGETVVATEQILFDSNNDFMQFYTPDLSKVEGATGYALTADGERITEVALENKDIVLYAIDTPVVSLAYGDTYKNYTVEGETFTFPAVADNFTITENFLCYSDGYSFYNEGDTVNAADVIGKTFTVVDSKYTKFNTSYGELVMLVDYDLAGVTTVTGSTSAGTIVPSYLNRDYVEGNVEHTDGNCVLSYAVTKENGGKVLKFRTSDKNVYNYWCVLVTSKVGGKYTALEDVKAEDTQGIAMENMFKGPWHRFLFDGTYKAPTVAAPTADWSVATVSYTVPNGITGTGYSYNRADKSYTPNIYKDNHAVYVYAKNTVYFMTEKNGTSAIKANYDASATTYKMPTAEELGMNVTNLVGWTNGTKSYKVGAEVVVSELANTAFYPVCQSAEEPAMGFTFEGERKASAVEVGGPIYTENIIDDGRDVLLVHSWNGKNGEGQSFPSDSRLSFRSGTSIPYYNPAEYNILQYSVKLGDMWAVVKDGDKVTGYKKTPTQNITVHAHTTAGGAYTNPVITCISKSLSTSDNYNIVEQDMSGNAVFTSKAGYGFCIEPCKATYGYNVYMDYFRVYRKGLQTITYNTNAPEGAAVLKEVAPDNNRGLGYGYLLKGDKPKVEGYIFLGWAESADSDEVVYSIDVDGDETVYAVWAKAESKAAPDMTDSVEIKGNGSFNGIRFKASILPSVKTNLAEFGFLATREVLLPIADEETGARNYDALTFLNKARGVNADAFVKGVAYSAEEGIDIVFGAEETGEIVYSVIISGIPEANKMEKMVVRPYSKFFVNGREFVVYGKTNAASLYDTALAVKEADGDSYKMNKTYIDSILAE